MALPSDANVDFLLCDAVRQNPNGKLDLAGYFPVHEVKLDVGAKLPVEINLTFVFVLKEGEGRFSPVFRIIDPLDKELHNHPLPEFSKLAGAAHVMMLPVGRIPITVSGNFTVSLEFEGQHYRRSVRIFQ